MSATLKIIHVSGPEAINAEDPYLLKVATRNAAERNMRVTTIRFVREVDSWAVGDMVYRSDDTTRIGMYEADCVPMDAA